MNTTEIRSASESDNPQDKHTDQEIQLVRLQYKVRELNAELERREKENQNLTQLVNVFREAFINKHKEANDLNQQLHDERKENIYITENYLKTSIMQQIFIILSNIVIGIGIANLSTNLGDILIIVGLCAYVASFIPASLDLRKYSKDLKARKRNR